MDLYAITEALEGHYSYSIVPEVVTNYTSKHAVLYCVRCYETSVYDPLKTFNKVRYSHILSKVQLPYTYNRCSLCLLSEVPASECVQCHEIYRHDEYFKTEAVSYVVIGLEQK